MATASKQRRASKPKEKRLYLALGDCAFDSGNETPVLLADTLEGVIEDLPAIIDECCGNEDCITIYEISAVKKVKRRGYDLRSVSFTEALKPNDDDDADEVSESPYYTIGM